MPFNADELVSAPSKTKLMALLNLFSGLIPSPPALSSAEIILIQPNFTHTLSNFHRHSNRFLRTRLILVPAPHAFLGTKQEMRNTKSRNYSIFTNRPNRIFVHDDEVQKWRLPWHKTTDHPAPDPR